MNTDKAGNKIAEKRISDKAKGKNERMLAAQAAKSHNNAGVHDSHCPQCGYRIRAAGHFQGKHHNS